MKALNKQTAPKAVAPERIIQFGEGNFLRAFVDWIISKMNQRTDFNSSVVVVQPIEHGMVEWLNGQDCLYHVNLQGLDKGEVVNSLTRIDVISRALNPYSQFDEYMKLAEQPEMRFVISNTTEAGYALFCCAKDLAIGTKHLTISDLADSDLIPPKLFGVICNAMAIRRYGLGAIQFK